MLILLLEFSFLFLRVLKEYNHATCFCIIQNISKGPLFCFIIWKIDNIVRLTTQSKLLVLYKIKLRACSLFTGAGMGWGTGLSSHRLAVFGNGKVSCLSTLISE